MNKKTLNSDNMMLIHSEEKMLDHLINKPYVNWVFGSKELRFEMLQDICTESMLTTSF